MSHLVPCPNCARHVRQNEEACPFCSTALSLSELPPPVLPRVRLGRAATFAFGASLVGATSLVACGGDSENGKEGGSSGAGGSSAGSTSGGTSSSGSNAGGTSPGGTGSGGTNSAGMGGNIAQPYGVPPTGGFGGTFAPAYGLPPGGMNGGGDSNAGSGGGPVPPYGAPPPK